MRPTPDPDTLTRMVDDPRVTSGEWTPIDWLWEEINQLHTVIRWHKSPRLPRAHAYPGKQRTSRAAADFTRPRARTQQRAILAALVPRGGLTDEQLQHGLGLNPSTERPRRLELTEAGWLEDSGETRRTRTGRRAIVWRMTEAGRAAWQAQEENS